jgi:hypothetical protein
LQIAPTAATSSNAAAEAEQEQNETTAEPIIFIIS